jgi:hypothetical protein
MSKVVIDTPESMKAPNYNFMAETYKFYSEKTRRFSIPNSFVFLNSWNTSVLAPKIWFKVIVGGVDNITTLSSVMYRGMYGTKIFLIGMDVIILCSDDANCLTWSYTPQIMFSTNGANPDWRGLSVTQNLSTFRTENFNSGFYVNYLKPPKYFAIGMSRLQINTNFRNFSLKINSVQPHSIDFNLTLGPFTYIDSAFFIGFSSDWGIFVYFL